MNKIIPLTGDQAAAESMRQIEPDVVAAYPITPQTIIVERYSEYVADGEVDTEFVAVESEHSAMSCSVGASAAGARAFTATASAGLALMWEMLFIAAGLRLPIVAAIANRALSAPINIHGDHSDTMGARDSGWIQIYSENCQEAYDNFIQAFRIAEHRDVRTPVLVGLDGFIISHSMEVIQVEDDNAVKDFVGEFQQVHVQSQKLCPEQASAVARAGCWIVPGSLEDILGIVHIVDQIVSVRHLYIHFHRVVR